MQAVVQYKCVESFVLIKIYLRFLPFGCLPSKTFKSVNVSLCIKTPTSRQQEIFCLYQNLVFRISARSSYLLSSINLLEIKIDPIDNIVALYACCHSKFAESSIMKSLN